MAAGSLIVQEGYSKPSFKPVTAEEEERGMREVRRIAVGSRTLGDASHTNSSKTLELCNPEGSSSPNDPAS